MKMSTGLSPVFVFCASFVRGQTGMSQTVESTTTLPKAHRISITKPLDCRSVTTSFVSEKDSQLETKVSVGTGHLGIDRRGERSE